MNAFIIHNMLWNHVELLVKSPWQRITDLGVKRKIDLNI
jgi:hypothetical protein